MITDNRCMKPIGMGTMHTQLMGTSCMGIKYYAGLPIKYGEYFKVCDGLFAMFHIHYLIRTIERIRTHWKNDSSFLIDRHSLDDSDITFDNRMLIELPLQVLMSILSLGNDKQS